MHPRHLHQILLERELQIIQLLLALVQLQSDNDDLHQQLLRVEQFLFEQESERFDEVLRIHVAMKKVHPLLIRLSVSLI